MDRRTFFRFAGGGLTSFLLFPNATGHPRAVIPESNKSAGLRRAVLQSGVE